MSIVIAGVVKNGLVIPAPPLPEGGASRNPYEQRARRGP